MSKSKQQKPSKPYSGFPLTPHANGKWCKKVQGRLIYFGEWADPNAALEEWQDYINGRSRKGEGLTLVDLCNKFLYAKEVERDAGEISPMHWADLKKDCEFMIASLGKQRSVTSMGPEVFTELRSKFPKTWNPTTSGGKIRRIKSVFNWGASDDVMLIENPIRFGSSFRPPKPKALRQVREERGDLDFSKDDVRAILEGCCPKRNFNLRAMVLLADATLTSIAWAVGAKPDRYAGGKSFRQRRRETGRAV